MSSNREFSGYERSVQGRIIGGGGSLSGVGVKRYVALLSQTSSNTPVATVLENTLDGTPVWSYVGTGNYRLTLTSAFPAAKTIGFASLQDRGGGIGFIRFDRLSDSAWTLAVANEFGGDSDDWNGCVTLIVYPA